MLLTSNIRGVPQTLTCPLPAKEQGRETRIDSTTFFYIAFALFSLISYFERTTYSTCWSIEFNIIKRGLQAIILVLIAIKYLSQRMSASHSLVYIIVVGIGLISWRVSKESWYFWAAAFIACSQGIEIKRVAKAVLGVVLFVTIAAILGAIVGIIDNITLYRQDGTERLAFGFLHPNSLGLVFLMVSICVSVVGCERKPIGAAAVSIFFAAAASLIADSNTAAILCVTMACLVVLMNMVKSFELQRRLRPVLLCIGIVLGVFSIVMMVSYSPDRRIDLLLNSVLNSRLSLAHEYYEAGSITLFGLDYRNIDTIYVTESGEDAFFVVDNAYCHLLLRAGLIPALIALIAFVRLYYVAGKRQLWNVQLMGLALMSICALSESYALRIETNIFLMILGPSTLILNDVDTNKPLYLKIIEVIGDRDKGRLKKMNLKLKGKMLRRIIPTFYSLKWKWLTKSGNYCGVDAASTDGPIVSLTSYPARIERSALSIRSLLMQTKKPKKIILWLAKDQFPKLDDDLPSTLLKLKENGLTIEWCDDLKSYKKLIPAVIKYPDEVIITADDDLYYLSDHIEKLWQAYKLDPTKIHCHRITKIIKLDNQWEAIGGGYDTYPKATYLHKLTGGAGACYPSRCFPKEMTDRKLYMSLAPTSDDIWFWLMAVKAGFKCNVILGNHPFLIYVSGTQEHTLAQINDCSDGKFWEHFNAVLDSFPEIRSVLNDEWKEMEKYVNRNVEGHITE